MHILFLVFYNINELADINTCDSRLLKVSRSIKVIVGGFITYETSTVNTLGKVNMRMND